VVVVSCGVHCTLSADRFLSDNVTRRPKTCMKIAYFTHEYPAVSHTFIRREIRALETMGVSVRRYALRQGENLVDKEDIEEQRETRYVFGSGVAHLALCCLSCLFRRPLAAGLTILRAIKMGWHSDSGILRHLAYVAEAAVLACWCREDGVQHLHVHFATNPAAVATLTWSLSGISYSFTAHGSHEFERATLMSLDVKLKNASFAVCVSFFGRGQLMRWSPPDQWDKIAVVRCGIDRVYLESAAPPPTTSPRLVCVGRLSEEKAHLVLVAAAHRLHVAGIDFKIVLAGDGPMRSVVEEETQRAGLQGKVTITGWITGEQVRAELTAARALVVPSFMENLPVVIMEAMALGRPVIASQVAGIPELVQPRTTGWLVPTGDDVALSEALREALEASVEQLSEMGMVGRSQVLERHDTIKEANKLKLLFERHQCCIIGEAAGNHFETDPSHST